jgi:hypothetical protein
MNRLQRRLELDHEEAKRFLELWDAKDRLKALVVGAGGGGDDDDDDDNDDGMLTVMRPPQPPMP